MKKKNWKYVAAAALMLVAAGGRTRAGEKPGPVPHKQFQLSGRPGLMLLDREGKRLYVEAGTSLLELDLKTWKASTIQDVLIAAHSVGTNGRHPEACRLYQREAPKGAMIVLRTPLPGIMVGGYKKGADKPVWTYQPPAIPPLRWGIDAQGVRYDGVPVDGFSVVGQTVYGVSKTGVFFALNMADGRQLWTLQLDKGKSKFVQPPLVSNGAAFVATGSGLFAVDLEKKKVKWHKRTKATLCSAPAFSEDMVYFSTNHHQNIMYAVDRATGKEIWRFGKGGSMGIMPPPVVGKDAIFVATGARGSGPSTCYALDKKTGKILWKKALGGKVYRAPVLVDGRLWLSIYKKKIIGIRETGQGPIHTFNLPVPEEFTGRLEHLAGMPGWLFATTTMRRPDNPTIVEHWLHVIKLPAAPTMGGKDKQ